MKIRHYCALLSLLLTVCLSAAAQTQDVPSDPSLKFQGLDGKVYDLADLRGNVVLLSFGATWCTPCTTELRVLQELLTEYRAQPVKFFWVSIERPEEVSNAALRRYARERKVTFPVLRDDAKMVFLQFSTRVRLPMIVMLNKNGKVDAPVKIGMQSQIDEYKTEIRERLNRLLTLPAPDVRGTGDTGAKLATTRSLASLLPAPEEQ